MCACVQTLLYLADPVLVSTSPARVTIIASSSSPRMAYLSCRATGRPVPLLNLTSPDGSSVTSSTGAVVKAVNVLYSGPPDNYVCRLSNQSSTITLDELSKHIHVYLKALFKAGWPLFHRHLSTFTTCVCCLLLPMCSLSCYLVTCIGLSFMLPQRLLWSGESKQDIVWRNI